MKLKNLLISSLLIALFFIMLIDSVKAQKNPTQNDIIAKKTGIILINPYINLKPGGYIIEIENNPIFNKSQSALEVILSVPGVFIRDSIIEVAGKKDMILQVNGFDLRLNAIQIQDYLSAISAETIKEVEVIQYPSAKYDSFTGSIVNVITKQNSLPGTSGVVRTAVGNFNKFQESAEIYMVSSKSNFSLSVADQYNRTYKNTIISTQLNPAIPEKIELLQEPKIILNKPLVNLNYSYKISDNHMIGASYEYWGDAYTSSLKDTITQPVTQSYFLNMSRSYKKSFERNALSLFSRSIYKNQSQLDLQYTILLNTNNDNNIFNRSWGYNGQTEVSNVMNEKCLSKYWINTFKAIYKFTVIRKILIETGIEMRESNFNNHLTDTTTQGFFGFSKVSRNSFSYSEQVAAPFLNFNLSFKKWNYMIGLRDEYSLYNISTYDSAQEYTNHILGSRSFGWCNAKQKGNYLYPNALVSYKINEKQLLTFVFKQVKTRPGLLFTPPYAYSFSIDFWTPEKNPVTLKTTSFDLTYALQPSQYQTYILSGGTSFSNLTSNKYIFVPNLNSGINPIGYKTKFNDSKVYLSLVSQIILNKWFAFGTSFVITDAKSSLKNAAYDLKFKNYPFEQFSFMGNVRLPKEVDLNFSYQFVSSFKTQDYNYKSNHYFNLVFKKTFLNKKVSTYIAIINPYHRLMIEKGGNLTTDSQYKSVSEAAVFKLGASYKFGKAK